MPTNILRKPRVKLFAVLSVLAVATSSTCDAEEGNYFAGKTVQLVVGFDAGGGYDLYARTVARHWARHIPGNPIFVTQNMPGAGTRTAGNWLYNVAPKDGTAVGTIVQSSAVDQALAQLSLLAPSGEDFGGVKVQESESHQRGAFATRL